MKSAILLKTITEKLKTIFPCFFYGTLVCIFLCGVSCKNQGTRDNTFTGGQSAGARMVDSLNSLMWHYYLDNPDSAEIIQYRTIRVIDSLQLQQQKIYAFLRLAEFYQYRKPDYQKAIKNLKEAVSIYTGSPGPYRTNPYFFVDIGNIFFHSRMYHQALTFYHISYMTARQESNFHARALALQNIALCFSEQEQFDSALFYFNRADMAVTDRTNPILAENAADKAALFLQAGHFDSARVYAGKSLSFLDMNQLQRSFDPQVQAVRVFLFRHEVEARAHGVLSGCFSSRHLPDSSLVHFRKACTSAGLARSIPLMAGLYLLRVLQGGCTDGLNAAGYADSAVFWAGRLNDPVLVKSYSDSLARFFSKNHLPALREKYARFSHHMADSIRRMKGSDELAGNEILLSSVATEQALNHLNKQQYYQDKSDRNLHTVFPVFFVLFTLLIFSLHFFSFRKKRLNPVILPISDASTLSDISKEPENHQRQSGQDKFLQISARLEELMVMQKPYLDKNLSLHDLAGMLSTNKTYVSQVINQQYGLKFNDYINGYRVKEACRLLRFPENKTTSIEHISERSGFNSISTFYHSFHKFAGMSPARFIKGIPLE